MTCNVRTSLGKDGDDHWSYRKDYCLEVIRSREPDLIGFQELQRGQFDDLDAGLPGFETYGMVDEPHTDSPVDGIFYRADRFALLSAGGYWLSETPHVTGSSSWESACVRLANWVRLREKASGMDFRFVNTHLDHVSQPARENQARLIVEDAQAYPEDYPQILTGDMNCDAENPALATFVRGGWRDTHAPFADDPNPNTFHRFLGPAFERDSGKIDWVFARGGLKAVRSEIVTDSRDGRYPSDHYFVLAEIVRA